MSNANKSLWHGMFSHIHGAVIAEKILQEFNYDADRIKLIQQCIRNHRGSVLKSKMTIEELWLDE